MDKSSCSFGAQIILKHLAALNQEIPGVRAASDIECIHRMRVASRRLRSALPLFTGCYARRNFQSWQKEIQKITGALGAARDSDVQLDLVKKALAAYPDPARRPGIKRLHLRLCQKRDSLQKDVLAALDRLDTKKTVTDLEKAASRLQAPQEPGFPFSAGLYELAAVAIRSKLEAFLAFEPFVNQPEAITELHEMRIAAKQLRYTMEIFATLYPGELQHFLQAVRSAQEMLGNIHDSDVWVGYVQVFLEEEKARILEFYGHTSPFNPLVPGIQQFLKDRQVDRQNEYNNFTRAWAKWSTKGLWQQLQATIVKPLNLLPQKGTYQPPVAIAPAVQPAQEKE